LIFALEFPAALHASGHQMVDGERVASVTTIPPLSEQAVDTAEFEFITEPRLVTLEFLVSRGLVSASGSGDGVIERPR